MRYIGAISDPTIGIAALSDAGRSGKNNEDDYVAFEAHASDEEGIPGEVAVQVLVVADGIGGNVAGEMASHLAAQTFYETFSHNSRQRVRQRLIESIDAANHAIYQKTLDQPELQGMGTTIVAAALVRDHLYVAHAGDSRAYLIRNGKAYQLTLDHTWAQEAIEAGRLTPAQARDHPNRHVIKRFLGIAPTVDIDSSLIDINRGPLDPEQIHTWPKGDQLTLQPGDLFLLCSDGLTDVVNDKQIEQTVARYQPQDAVRKLIDLANSAGGPDNITVLLLQRRQPGAAVTQRSSRSPMVAAALGALLVVLAVAAWLLLGNQGETTAGVTATATPLKVAEAASATPPPTKEPTATTAPTVTPVPAIATKAPTITSIPTLAAVTAPTLTTALTVTTETTTTSDVDALLSQVTTDTINAGQAIDAQLNGSPTQTQTTVTPTVTGTKQKRPTSTPISEPPTATPTMTPSVTPTPSATRTSTPASAITTVANTPVVGSNNALATDLPTTVTLLAPNEGDTLDTKLTFSWSSNMPLPVGYQFEPIFWQVGEDPMQDGKGYGGSSSNTGLSIGVEVFRSPGEGEYYWGILLVKIAPYTRVAYLGGQRLIHVKLSTPGSDSSSGGGSSPPSGGNRED